MSTAVSRQQALLFHIQKYSLHDGTGIRTAFFFKGCPLSCLWCHNPEGIDFRAQLMVYQERCRGCGRCDKICPEKRAEPDATASGSCTVCGACTDACPYGAREIAGKPYTVDALLRIAEQDRVFYDTSRGGVTLAGGEVMAQDPVFLIPLLRGLKRRRLDVAVDTCGHAPFEAFEAALPFVDTFLYDVKLLDGERHKHFTGQDNRLILSNLEKLSEKGARLHIRIPVIEGVNAGDTDMDAIRCYLKSNVRAESVGLLPYHALGQDKYLRLGKTATCFQAPDNQRLKALAARFRQDGFAVDSSFGV